MSQQINSIIFPLEAENSHDQWGDGLPLYGCEGATGHRGKALREEEPGLGPGGSIAAVEVWGGDKELELSRIRA